ncbi:efflux transporter outer membrane subunit [Sphingomonas jatrophae]|uniref:Efflux transporter, outer membrane factor (OMF) lipoprotein, NodT family n=1 Tax=Sphingomonas jatrophae TaxID=1166337 RepID=A0A1I6JCQ2_9SPHN|nr:efflux transporter outer membrane subunit [Sphingomonas jatrophae]SFR76702.1 efflux transporter, outer membrane factor (OMF) lipoprotein, NodT family [Sphingomonas jatrophae]
MRRSAILITAIVIAGCAGDRPPLPPASAVAPPNGWRTDLGPGAPIAADWWSAFGDSVLTQLVARGLANNVDIAVAAERVEEARAQQRLAEAQRQPGLTAGAPLTEARALNAFGVPAVNTGFQPALQASYDLDLFGRLRQASRAARAQLLASEGAADAVRLAVASGIASAYITLRGLDARLAVARETLSARAEGLRIARRRADAGYTSALELHQSEAEYRAAQQLVPQLELAISRQENALSLLIGDPPAGIGRGLPLARLRTPAIPDGLPADLLRRRPDLFQAEQTLVAADRTLDSARAALLPSVSLTGSAGLVLSTALSDPVGVFSLGGSVLAPIFDAGRLRAQVDAAEARRDQAAFSYRRSALTAFREVEDSLAGVRRSGEQARALIGQRDALAAALRNATNRYRAGYSSYLEQLDAQRGLLSAELGAIQAETDRLSSYVALYQAMGGGWRGAAPAP